jgi:co-chaperonin GroES (HSP10)
MLLPIRNNVLVLAMKDPDTWYESSLIIRPESTKDRANQGFVKAVGPEVKDIEVGDYVCFSAYAGTVINDSEEGQTQIMLSENGITAKLYPPTTKVENVWIETEDGPVPATSEALLLLIREAFQKLPPVMVQKEKFEGRFV